MTPQLAHQPELRAYEVQIITVDAYKATFTAASEEEARELGRNFYDCDELKWFDHVFTQIDHIVAEEVPFPTGGAR